MKGFLKNILLFGLPIFGLFLILEMAIRTNNPFKIKNDYLLQNKNEIELLVLGPSTAKRSVNTKLLDVPSASLAQSGSNIFADRRIFDRFAPELPKLKYLLLEMSDGYLFSGDGNSWRNDHALFINYNIAPPTWNVRYLFYLPNHFKWNLDFLWGNKILNKGDRYDERGFPLHVNSEFEAGFNKKTDAQLKVALGNLLRRHNHYDMDKFRENEKHLDHILERTADLNIKVILFSAPKLADYRKGILPEMLEESRAAVKRVVSENAHVNYLDLSDVFDDNNEYFRNFNHLSLEGATQFTKILNQKIGDY